MCALNYLLSTHNLFSWRIRPFLHQQRKMYPSTLSLFNLLLALSLLFSLTSAFPVNNQMGDVSFRAEAHIAQRQQPSAGRLHARSFNVESAPIITHLERDEPTRSQVVKRNRVRMMENSLRGKTKVYSGNYWRRKVYHL